MSQKPRHARALTFERGLNPRSNVNYEFRIANYELLIAHGEALSFECGINLSFQKKLICQVKK